MKIREKTNFSVDVELYGPIGEKTLKKHLIDKNKTFIDTSEAEGFRMFDIDIIQTNNKDVSINDCLNCLRYGKSLSSLDAIGYEVKTDTVGLKSRNLVFEVFSNSNPGCLARSAADYLYYVFIDDSNNVIEEFLIKMKTLRHWLMEHFWEINNVNYLKSKSMRRQSDNTGILLVNVEKLIEDKICIKLNTLG